VEAKWLHKQDRERILVFCAGWGMDERPFQKLDANCYDVLILYNFKKITSDSEIRGVINRYREKILIGWSMGVWCGQKLFKNRTTFDRTIAVNGTLCPIHDHYGIPRDLFFSTLQKWSPETRMKFYRRMCRDKGLMSTFLENMPARGVEDQKEELAGYLQSADCIDSSESIYSEIIVSDNDLVVATSNQVAFWEGCKTTILAGSHFPFYQWKSWDELLLRSGTNETQAQEI
jgi:pimeloyl-[acyl-carrier protein] methyl ester esterase